MADEVGFALFETRVCVGLVIGIAAFLPSTATENSNVLDLLVVLNYLKHSGYTFGLRFHWIHWSSLGAMDIAPSLSTWT